MLMLRYGIDSHQAFALLVRWSPVTRTPVTTFAQTLLRGICEGNPHTVLRQRSLVRWLEVELRDGDPAVDGPGGTRVAREPTPETPRATGPGGRGVQGRRSRR